MNNSSQIAVRRACRRDFTRDSQLRATFADDRCARTLGIARNRRGRIRRFDRRGVRPIAKPCRSPLFVTCGIVISPTAGQRSRESPRCSNGNCLESRNMSRAISSAPSGLQTSRPVRPFRRPLSPRLPPDLRHDAARVRQPAARAACRRNFCRLSPASRWRSWPSGSVTRAPTTSRGCSGGSSASGRRVMESRAEAWPTSRYYRGGFHQQHGVANEFVRHRDPVSAERCRFRRGERWSLDGPSHDDGWRRRGEISGAHTEE